jgi:hypothetical protein
METLGGLDELKYKPAASLGCMIARPAPAILTLRRLGTYPATCSLLPSLTKFFGKRIRRVSRRQKQCWRNIPGTRTNGRRGFKMFPLLTATWCCLCRRQHGPTIFVPRTRLKIDRLGITSICPSNQKVNQFDVQIRNPERVNILTAMAENERVVKSEKRLPCFLPAPLLVRDDC